MFKEIRSGFNLPKTWSLGRMVSTVRYYQSKLYLNCCKSDHSIIKQFIAQYRMSNRTQIDFIVTARGLTMKGNEFHHQELLGTKTCSW